MTDQATTSSEAAPVSLPEVAEQIAGFEGRVTHTLREVTRKLNGLEKHGGAQASAAAAPAAEATSMPSEPVPAAQALAASALVAEAAQIPPVAASDAREGENHPGILSNIAHKVVDLAEGAVGAVRSLAEPTDEVELGNSDAIVATPTTAPLAGAAPIGPHTQAVVEERRMQPAPSVVAA